MKHQLGNRGRGNHSFVAARILQIIGFAAIGIFSVAIAGIILLKLSPEASAYGADELRNLIGDKPVAIMEMTLFQAQDALQNMEYRLGLAKASNPFGNAADVTRIAQAPSTKTPSAIAPFAAPAAQAYPAKPAVIGDQNVTSQPTVQAPSQMIVPVTGASDWNLPAIEGQSGKYGDGTWQPYITDASGRVVAYRTYVQPDPSRPYTYAAIVAFDLAHTRLHYVIGMDEPYPKGAQKTTSGTIPAADKQPGVLLAAFNGGFKYEHGQSGSMAGGLVSAPPHNGYGTVALYSNGQIKIGEWGKDIQPGPDLVAYRQNGPLAIQDGIVNPQVNEARLWGLTLDGKTVTFRSSLAISADGRTLYYFAGHYITAPILATAMEMVHPQAAIQLDINDYWVYFTSFTDQGGRLTPEPLLPKAMIGNPDRLLRPYARDFFYVTAKP